MKGLCKNCDYWKEWSVEEAEYDEPPMVFTRGNCLRHAPTPVTTEELDNDDTWGKHFNQHLDTLWPSTKSGQWCGEYRERIA